MAQELIAAIELDSETVQQDPRGPRQRLGGDADLRLPIRAEALVDYLLSLKKDQKLPAKMTSGQ